MVETTIFENEFIRQGILFGRAFVPALPCGWEMEMDVQRIVAQVLSISGLKQEQLGGKLGVSQGTISKWKSGKEAPNFRQWIRLRDFAHSRADLRHLASNMPAGAVPLMGYIGAGAQIDPDFEQVPPEGLDQVGLPFDAPEGLVAFQVRGESMRPAYRDGDVVLVWDNRHDDPETLVGKEAVILTEDGRRFLKEIQRGARKGVYDLYSHNDRTIIGVKVKWLARVFLTLKADQVRSLARESAA